MIYHLYIGTGKHPAEHVYNGSKEKCVELAQRWLKKMEFDANAEMVETSDNWVIWDTYGYNIKWVPAYVTPEIPHGNEDRFSYWMKHTKAPKKHKR